MRSELADSTYLTHLLIVWGDAVTALSTISEVSRTSATLTPVMHSIIQLMDARRRLAWLSPSEPFTRLHQDLRNLLDRACEVILCTLEGKSAEALAAALADLAEDLRIVLMQVQRHVAQM